MATSSTGTAVADGVYTTLFEANTPGGSGTDGGPRGWLSISTSADAVIKIWPGYESGFTLTAADGDFDYIPKVSNYGPITKVSAAGSGGAATIKFKFKG